MHDPTAQCLKLHIQTFIDMFLRRNCPRTLVLSSYRYDPVSEDVALLLPHMTR
jgi:hypothetical protein